MWFSRQEYWSGLPFLPQGDLPHPGTEPVSPALQADSLPLRHLGSHYFCLEPCKPSICRRFFFFPILLSASWTSFIYLQPLSLSTGRYQAWPGNQYEPEKQDISFLFHTSKWGKLLRMLREQLAAHHPFFSACMANTGIIFCQGYGPRLNSKTLFLWWSQSKISFTSWKLL